MGSREFRTGEKWGMNHRDAEARRGEGKRKIEKGRSGERF